MLARVLAMILAVSLHVSLSVCLSVCVCVRLCYKLETRSSIKTDGRINLLFGVGLLSISHILCFKEI